jgi:hypothetical protein
MTTSKDESKKVTAGSKNYDAEAIDVLEGFRRL